MIIIARLEDADHLFAAGVEEGGDPLGGVGGDVLQQGEQREGGGDEGDHGGIDVGHGAGGDGAVGNVLTEADGVVLNTVAADVVEGLLIAQQKLGVRAGHIADEQHEARRGAEFVVEGKGGGRDHIDELTAQRHEGLEGVEQVADMIVEDLKEEFLLRTIVVVDHGMRDAHLRGDDGGGAGIIAHAEELILGCLQDLLFVFGHDVKKVQCGLRPRFKSSMQPMAAVQGLRAMVSIEHESHELATNRVQSDACIDYAEVRRKKRT